MTNRSMLAVSVLVLCPLGIAIWILAAHTIGESLASSSSTAIGFAVALLVVVTAGYLLLFTQITESPVSRMGQTLVICGTACVLIAVALQFYLASVSSENARRSADILNESIRSGRNITNVNIKGDLPGSVQGVGYLALFAGVWLAATGILMGVGRGEKALRPATEERFASSSDPMGAVETGIRQGGEKRKKGDIPDY